MAQIPLMVLSDAPTSSTGLGRITRELCQRIHEHLPEVFELATFGHGGTESRKLPWRQYTVRRIENWVTPELPTVWNDFAGERKGVLLAIWNPGWLPWLADPSKLPPSGLRTFLESKPFEKWIYAPIDAVGANWKLPESIKEILQGFDRVLAYTKWAADLIDQSCPHLPHGIDTNVFYPRDAKEVRRNFVQSVSGRHSKPVPDDMKIVGIVATNSARKDWGLGFEVCSELLKRGENIGVWAHTDFFHKHWDLVELANVFGLARRVILTNGSLTDDTLAMAYSGCNVTLGIGSGEGWGMPLAESLACGTHVVTGNYAGASGFVPDIGLVQPLAYRLDGGIYCHRRPVFNPKEWADRAQFVCTLKNGESWHSPEYSWDNLWPKWHEWLVGGING